MQYVTVATLTNDSTRTAARRGCDGWRPGEMPGARKVGRSWRVPVRAAERLMAKRSPLALCSQVAARLDRREARAEGRAVRSCRKPDHRSCTPSAKAKAMGIVAGLVWWNFGDTDGR